MSQDLVEERGPGVHDRLLAGRAVLAGDLAGQPLRQQLQERGAELLELRVGHFLVAMHIDHVAQRRGLVARVEVEDGGHTQIFQPPAAGPTSQSRTRLLLATGGSTHVIPLESTQLTIGRGLNNDVILEDTRVSRHHAQLRYRARRFWLSDLGSTNGTYINGEQVAEQALRDGDIISLGGLELTFKEA